MMVALRRWNTFQSRRPIPSSVFRQPKRSFEGLREEEVQLACSELGKFNHDRGMGRTIGTRHEFEGLYHLALPSSTTFACATTTTSPLQIHSRG
ncbi:uncharacterized protein LOC127799416 isoform X2 [Diospyros lotus]|uniref:uncharacterized protein LOC127799416 isoform X2 n=1 Tax=Diospyros lotus TaxID=55363 RepID=UPI002257240B|nr:uncharacterized protein LOC127799416 isoform X2 [Diospyros lotus]